MYEVYDADTGWAADSEYSEAGITDLRVFSPRAGSPKRPAAPGNWGGRSDGNEGPVSEWRRQGTGTGREELAMQREEKM